MNDYREIEDTKFTRWSVVASGEGAGRVASLYFIKTKNEAIENRVLLMNSMPADINNTLRELARYAETDEERKNVKNIKKSNTFIFGDKGAGQFWPLGEKYARDDFENVIRRRIEALGTTGGDVILMMAALGGGTGNGSIPFIINQLKQGKAGIWIKHKFFAMGIFPHYNEGDSNHWNAICGLSRLLKFGDKYMQNADMVILVDNTHLSTSMGKRRHSFIDYLDINTRIIQAIDLIIAPGRTAHGVIDARDYCVIPGQMGIYHFAPCVSLDNDINLIGLEMALDDTLENSFVPFDPTTALFAYLVVRVPERFVDKNGFREKEMNDLFADWLSKNGFIIKHRKASLAYIENSKEETFDVLLLLGGFNLDMLLEKSWEKYKDFKIMLETASKGNVISFDGATLTIDELNRIENNLTSYLELNNKLIEGAK